MSLVDHKLKTNAIKTQQTHTQTKQQSRGNKTSKTVPQFESICQGKSDEKRDEKSDEKTFIYIVFSLKCRRRRSEREIPVCSFGQERNAAPTHSFLDSVQAWPALNLALILAWLGLAWVFFFGDWGLRFGFWVLVSVRLWLFNCLCLASIFGGSSASFGAVTNSARRSWPRVLNA